MSDLLKTGSLLASKERLVLAGNPLTLVEQQWGHKGAANGKYPPQAGPID